MNETEYIMCGLVTELHPQERRDGEVDAVEVRANKAVGGSLGRLWLLFWDGRA